MQTSVSALGYAVEDASVTDTVTTGCYVNIATQATAQNLSNFIPLWDRETILVSPEARQLVDTVFRCGVQFVLAFIGMPANLLCLLVFSKQGLRNRINALLFAISAADLMYLVSAFVWRLRCLMDPVDALNWSVIMLAHISYVNRYFATVIYLLSLLMSVDRCLTITLPLLAGDILSFRQAIGRTHAYSGIAALIPACATRAIILFLCSQLWRMVTVIVLIYVLSLAAYFPMMIVYTVKWQYDPLHKRNMAYYVVADYFQQNVNVPTTLLNIIKLIVSPISMVAMIVCCIVSISMLMKAGRQRATMMRGNDDNVKNSTKTVLGKLGHRSGQSSSDLGVTKMLLFLCCSFIVCAIPDVVGNQVIYFVPEFYLYRKFHNIFIVFASITITVECAYSTLNFFAYFSMSGKFRQTLNEILPCFKKVSCIVKLGFRSGPNSSLPSTKVKPCRMVDQQG